MNKQLQKSNGELFNAIKRSELKNENKTYGEDTEIVFDRILKMFTLQPA
jgi:hypothetical protein